MTDEWNKLSGDVTDLTAALSALEGTQLDEQVFIAARTATGEQPDPLLDIAHTEEEPGDGRYQVYLTLPAGTTLDDFDLPWPTGTMVVDDSGDNATLELGAASARQVARALTDVAATLASEPEVLVWSATLDA
jgi:hypothetical protein